MKKLEWTKTTFGKSLDIDFQMPSDCDVIVLCVMDLQLHPIRVLLPHQIYQHDVKKLLTDHSAGEIGIIPYNSKNTIYLKRDQLFPRTKKP